MRFSTFFLSAGLTSYVFGVKMSDRYTISSTCDTTKMDALLTESISMVDNAITALDKLQGSILFANTELVNIIEAGVTAWGITPPGMFTRSFGAAEKARLKKAQNKYKILLAALQDGTGMSPTQNYLFCDSTTLEWTTQASEIFTKAPADQTIENYFSSVKAGIEGIWKDTEHKSGDEYNWIVDEYDGGTICGPHAATAITYRRAPKSMFLCPVTFGNDFKTSLEGNRKDADKKKWPEIQSSPGVFIHEMMHWLDLKPASEHVTDEKIVVPGDGGSMLAYGMMAVWLLAGNNEGDTANAGRKDATLTNADSYNVFATMVYIPGADFAP